MDREEPSSLLTVWVGLGAHIVLRELVSLREALGEGHRGAHRIPRHTVTAARITHASYGVASSLAAASGAVATGAARRGAPPAARDSASLEQGCTFFAPSSARGGCAAPSRSAA